jgi:hypothetical protein
MLEANQDPCNYDLHDLTEYLERLEGATAIHVQHSAIIRYETSKHTSKRKNGNGNDPKNVKMISNKKGENGNGNDLKNVKMIPNNIPISNNIILI